MYPLPPSFSVRDLQRSYRKVIDTAKQTKDAVVLIGNSVPEAVLLDIETYQRLAKDDYALDETYTTKQVKAARASYRAGRAKPLKNWNDLDR